MTVEKPKPKQLLRPITTRANSAMNQSQFLAIICVHGAIGFGFASHWLKNWTVTLLPDFVCMTLESVYQNREIILKPFTFKIIPVVFFIIQVRNRSLSVGTWLEQRILLMLSSHDQRISPIKRWQRLTQQITDRHKKKSTSANDLK